MVLARHLSGLRDSVGSNRYNMALNPFLLTVAPNESYGSPLDLVRMWCQFQKAIKLWSHYRTSLTLLHLFLASKKVLQQPSRSILFLVEGMVL